MLDGLVAAECKRAGTPSGAGMLGGRTGGKARVGRALFRACGGGSSYRSEYLKDVL